MEYTVIVPAYNEEKTLPSLLKSLRRVARRIIVVDDGSTDRTYETARKFGVSVIKHERNFGKGYAVASALKECKTDFVVLIDADGQHLPSEIPLLLKKLRKCDLVIGNRFAKKQHIPFHRLVANKLLSVLLKSSTGVSDPLCGFRAFRKEKFSNLREREFNIELEILFKAVDSGLTICEVPITVKYPSRNSKTAGLLGGAIVYLKLLLYAVSWLFSTHLFK
ncbi:MAG: glycosyltransferase family 2 protein [Candidatus Micrarchaeia archaeon]